MPSLTVFSVPLELGVGACSQKTILKGLPDGQKRFRIGLVVYSQYRHVTDGRTDGQTPHEGKDRAM